jgi:hypothetical protein
MIVAGYLSVRGRPGQARKFNVPLLGKYYHFLADPVPSSVADTVHKILKSLMGPGRLIVHVLRATQKR